MSHIHEWVEQAGVTIDSETYRCAECEATSDLCHVCSGPSGGYGWICDGCLEREKRVLTSIERYLELWDERDRDRAKSPAAFALVVAHGSGDGGPSGPEDVLSVLWSWVARWTEHMGADNASPAEYLAARIMWAIHNPNLSGWDDFPREMRRARGMARSIVGLSPERLPQRCPRCSGGVVRDREEAPGVPCRDGLQDEVRCTGCRFVWRDEGAFMAAARVAVEHVAAIDPTVLVTREQARKIWPSVDRKTWHDWRRHDGLFVDGPEVAGRVQALVDRRLDPARPGRPARQMTAV